jgi:hypothetical protein
MNTIDLYYLLAALGRIEQRSATGCDPARIAKRRKAREVAKKEHQRSAWRAACLSGRTNLQERLGCINSTHRCRCISTAGRIFAVAIGSWFPFTAGPQFESESWLHSVGLPDSCIPSNASHFLRISPFRNTSFHSFPRTAWLTSA